MGQEWRAMGLGMGVAGDTKWMGSLPGLPMRFLFVCFGSLFRIFIVEPKKELHWKGTHDLTRRLFCVKEKAIYATLSLGCAMALGRWVRLYRGCNCGLWSDIRRVQFEKSVRLARCFGLRAKALWSDLVIKCLGALDDRFGIRSLGWEGRSCGRWI